MIGHVTKTGAIAGPRVLEHIVDTVLYLEGERFHTYRVLRSVKNRFGATNEVGIFEMNDDGLREVINPSEIFLAERLPNAAGSAIAITIEGTRPILVEVQALASTTSFGNPRRTTNGVEMNRLLLLIAVLTRRVGIKLGDQDVFANVIGGMQINEPASDLAVATAIASSFRNQPVAADIALVGEVGLSGELRTVGHLEHRLKEAAKLGFKRCVLPTSGQVKSSENINILRLLGQEGDWGYTDLGLDSAALAQAIAAVGNYGEIYNRYMGPDGLAFTLPRGPNELWTNGGLIYAPPVK